MSEVHSSATLGHLHVSESSHRLAGHEQVASAVSLVLVVISLYPARLGPDSRPLIGHQLLGCLIEADHRMIGVVGLVVQVKHILHPGHELPAYLRDAPFLLLPRLEFVFFSVWRTVSREMLSANPIWTTLSASSCSVQCVCPSGASLQAMATRCASCIPSSLRLWPGLGRSLSAPSSPSCTNRVRTRPTVEVLMNSPLAMSWSDNPSSAPSNTSARLTLRADLSPRRAISLRCVRPRSFNSTLYLIAGMSSYVLLLQIIHKTNPFLILVKCTWNRYRFPTCRVHRTCVGVHVDQAPFQ